MKMKKLLFLLAPASLIGAAVLLMAFAPIQSNLVNLHPPLQVSDLDTVNSAPDNTAVNRQGTTNAGPTADQAKNNASDIDIMRKIRQAIIYDKSLSTYAHNVKIISQNGKVTLKGPVRSQEESQNIENKAAEIAGAENVTNELSLKIPPQ